MSPDICYLRVGQWRGSNPGGDEIFRTLLTCTGAHPPSCTRSRGSFPGVKQLGRGVDPHDYLAPRLKKEYSYTYTPPLCLRGVLWDKIMLLGLPIKTYITTYILISCFSCSLSLLITHGELPIFFCTFFLDTSKIWSVYGIFPSFFRIIFEIARWFFKACCYYFICKILCVLLSM